MKVAVRIIMVGLALALCGETALIARHKDIVIARESEVARKAAQKKRVRKIIIAVAALAAAVVLGVAAGGAYKKFVKRRPKDVYSREELEGALRKGERPDYIERILKLSPGLSAGKRCPEIVAFVMKERLGEKSIEDIWYCLNGKKDVCSKLDDGQTLLHRAILAHDVGLIRLFLPGFVYHKAAQVSNRDGLTPAALLRAEKENFADHDSPIFKKIFNEWLEILGV